VRKSSNFSRRTSSSESEGGGSTPRLKNVVKASITKGDYESKMTSMHGTLPSYDNTLKTHQNRLEVPVSKEVLSPRSIPHSPNYFDALLEMEEDAPLEERAARWIESKWTQETSVINVDPKKKASMPLN